MSWFGDTVGRALQRLLSGTTRPCVNLVHHPGYEVAIPGVPMDPLRGQRIIAYLIDQGLVRERDIFTPTLASLREISRVHTSEYLDRLDSAATMESVLGFTVSDSEWQSWIDAQRLMAGGTIQATSVALRAGGVAINLGGGLHHASPDRGAGYCAINDVAIAIARLRARGYRKPILVIDLDIHDGNGTRAAFREDATVHTFSVHNETWDQGPALQDTCVALGSGVTDRDYLDAIERHLGRVMDSFHPGMVVYLAGVDPAADDRIGDWRISDEGMLQRDRLVFREIDFERAGVPVVVVLGGGYGNTAWRHSARFLGWTLSGRELDPQEDIDSIVRRFRRIEDAVARASHEVSRSDWVFTQDDVMLGMRGAADSRIFGHYTKHGLELQLERLGILNQIRARGFRTPTLSVDSGSETGHTVRIFGDPGRKELLMELRARRDRAELPGMEVLYIEWLLLQNPRLEFTSARPRLPGQERPGLGLLREIVALLMVICEQAGLDGILFVPAHYYMAALGRRHLRFLRVRDAATYDSIHDALYNLELAQASRAIDEGRLVDSVSGGSVEWHTPPMILPISKRMAGRFDEPEKQADYAAIRSRLSYVLSDEA